MMKKLLKNVLSLALVLALVLSLGVTAFADGTDAKDEEEDEVEIIDIAFNLCTGEPCAVRMRELGYDDIRLNGISYKADAEDGVIAIHLGDLAAAKLLTEKKDEAEKAGIDFDKIYIRNGKVCVDGDAALSATVNSFMTANKLNVSIGDIFELSNGSELKLKVRVVNFYYPEQCAKPQTVKLVDNELAEDAFWGGKIETPAVTTVYLYYEGSQDYKANEYEPEVANEENAEGKSFIRELVNKIKFGILGIAKDKNDKNDYYMQGFSKSNPTGTSLKPMLNLTEDDSVTNWIYSDGYGLEVNYDAFFSYDYYYIDPVNGIISEDMKDPFTKAIIYKNDKDEVYKEFDFEDKTADLADLMNNQNDKEALAKLGYTVEEDETGNLTFTPINSTVITEVKENSYKVVYMDKITVNLENVYASTSDTLALTAPAAPVVDAAPVETDTETEEPAAEPAEEPAEEVTEEEPAEEVKDEEAAEETEEVNEEAAEVTEGTTDAAPAQTTEPEAGTTETPTLTQAELDEIERKKKLAEEEAARLAAEAAAEIPTDAE